MFSFRKFCNAVGNAAMLTLLLAAGTCVYLMLGAGEGSTRRTGLFGTVVYESRDEPGAAFDITAGIENVPGLLVIFAVLVALCCLATVLWPRFRARRHDEVNPRATRGSAENADVRQG